MLKAMPIGLSRLCGWSAGLICMVFAGRLTGAEFTPRNETPAPVPLPAITNLLQVRQLGMQNSCISHPIRLEGQVCWVTPEQKAFAMLDASGGLILEMEWLNQSLSIGQRVRLTGAATVRRAGNTVRVGVDGLVVDDDALHPMIE